MHRQAAIVLPRENRLVCRRIRTARRDRDYGYELQGDKDRQR
jgi:hypothetical protein